LQLTGSNCELSGIAMMMQLRKMANHPALLRYYFTDEQLQDMARRLAADHTYKETNPEYIVQVLAMMSDYQIHQLSSFHKVRCPLHLCFISAMAELPVFCSC
jgi:SWI/SNF-related matrix-associated actin-dependent regulator 1 of chromatin subfamily A